MHNELIFAYGSLINSESRARTFAQSRVLSTAVLHGYTRGWFFKDEQFGKTAVGICKDELSSCNGLILEVDPIYLDHCDLRELGYERVRIAKERFQTAEPLEKDVWAYVPHDRIVATEQFPIAQSYIDVIIAGCLEYSHGFAEEWIASTHEWSAYWINDRESQKCRGLLCPSLELLHSIDMLLTPTKERYLSYAFIKN